MNSIVDKIFEILKPKLELLNMPVELVELDESLLQQGILDSISFLEFIVTLEQTCNIEIDFEDLDPSEFTSINQLASIVGKLQ